MLEQLRVRLAHAEAVPQLALLAIITGLLAGAVILLFRLGFEQLQGMLLPAGGSENYEALPPLLRLLLPIAGAALIGLLFQAAGAERRQVGVTHVMSRLNDHQGRLPLSNALLQFIGAQISIGSGHSVGREGPGVHLGAAAGSLLGHQLQLPNNSVRTLVACGIAAAIGASFNTPLAGVIFAMEVVLLEYTVAGFAPIILAAVSATSLTRLVYGADPAFTVPPLQLGSLWELPYLLLAGLLIGVLSAGFIKLLCRCSRFRSDWSFWQRALLGGSIVGLLALPVPEIMGIGYDTVTAALLGELGIVTLLAVVGVKLLATTVALGLGLPGGLIGPTLVIGASAGGAFGLLAAHLFPDQVVSPALYAMVGMGAMMGGTLLAPLAALIALLELTANPNILLPAMLTIVTAHLTVSELFGYRSIFIELLQLRGLGYHDHPLIQLLRRRGVMAATDSAIVIVPQRLSAQAANALLQQQTPRWLLVDIEQQRRLFAAAELAIYLQQQPPTTTIDLSLLPSLSHHPLPTISAEATLQEALELLEQQQCDAACVVGQRGRRGERLYGIVTRTAIEADIAYLPLSGRANR